MDDSEVEELCNILNIPPNRRSKSQLQLIFDRLRAVQSLSKLRDTELKKACAASKYKFAEKNSKIYRKGDLVQGWYVLLSGSVFVNSSMFLPLISFGHDPFGRKRQSDCLALEPSYILYVDISSASNTHNQMQQQQQHQNQQNSHFHSSSHSSHTNNSNNLNNISQQNSQSSSHHQHSNSRDGNGSLDSGYTTNKGSKTISNDNTSTNSPNSINSNQRDHQILDRSSSSRNNNLVHSNNPSSANSSFQRHRSSASNESVINTNTNNTNGSNMNLHHDDNKSISTNSLRRDNEYNSSQKNITSNNSNNSSHNNKKGSEHVRNSSLISSSSNHSRQEINRDNVKEVFEKDPQDRTEEDIDILADYTKTLPAFMNLTDPVRRKLCSYMVFVQIDLAGTLVLGDQEELDSWSVILNGKVKVTYEDCETINELEFGDDFGVRPTLDRQVHQGIMQTLCNDCQFICIAQHDYYNVLHESQDAQRRVLGQKTGEVCMIEERRFFDHDIRHNSMKIDRIYPDDGADQESLDDELGHRQGYVVIRGTPSALLEQLMDHDTATDPTYIEDFLLRGIFTFFISTSEIL